MKNIIAIVIHMIFFQSGTAQDLIPYRDMDKWGYANSKGELIIEPQFEDAGEFRDKITWVKKNGKYGYVDKNGNGMTCLKFDKANYFDFGTASVTEGEDTYCIDLEGKRTKCIFGCGGSIMTEQHFKTYRENGKTGVVTYNMTKDENGGNKMRIDTLPPTWEGFKENHAGYAAVKKDSLWAIINENGELVTPYKYNSVEVHPIGWRNKFFKVTLNGKYGFLDNEGNLVIEPQYFKVDFFTQSKIAKVWIDRDFWGYIDENGNEYFKKKNENDD